MRILIFIYADPDQNFHPDADPVPVPSFQLKAQTLENAQIGSYSIYFGLSGAKYCYFERG